MPIKYPRSAPVMPTVISAVPIQADVFLHPIDDLATDAPLLAVVNLIQVGYIQPVAVENEGELGDTINMNGNENENDNQVANQEEE